MCLAPRCQLLELGHSWWQAAAGVYYVLAGLTFYPHQLHVRAARRDGNRPVQRGRRFGEYRPRDGGDKERAADEEEVVHERLFG